jgi:hypothetical protein
LTYYVNGEEGVFKEVRYIDLAEWAGDKDVYLEYTWSDRPSTRLFDSRKQRNYRQQRDYSWRVRYAEAGIEGQSRVFIVGLGREARARIYNADDLVTFIQVGAAGWQEMGGLARYSRFMLRNGTTAQTPLPARTQ